MSESTNKQSEHTDPQLCLVCKDMYGHPSFKNMCSVCFKNSKVREDNDKVKMKKDDEDDLELTKK